MDTPIGELTLTWHDKRPQQKIPNRVLDRQPRKWRQGLSPPPQLISPREGEERDRVKGVSISYPWSAHVIAILARLGATWKPIWLSVYCIKLPRKEFVLISSRNNGCHPRVSTITQQYPTQIPLALYFYKTCRSIFVELSHIIKLLSERTENLSSVFFAFGNVIV